VESFKDITLGTLANILIKYINDNNNNNNNIW
jgi:hypothetical protein